MEMIERPSRFARFQVGLTILCFIMGTIIFLMFSESKSKPGITFFLLVIIVLLVTKLNLLCKKKLIFSDEGIERITPVSQNRILWGEILSCKMSEFYDIEIRTSSFKHFRIGLWECESAERIYGLLMQRIQVTEKKKSKPRTEICAGIIFLSISAILCLALLPLGCLFLLPICISFGIFFALFLIWYRSRNLDFQARYSILVFLLFLAVLVGGKHVSCLMTKTTCDTPDFLFELGFFGSLIAMYRITKLLRNRSDKFQERHGTIMKS